VRSDRLEFCDAGPAFLGAAPVLPRDESGHYDSVRQVRTLDGVPVALSPSAHPKTHQVQGGED
jgi:hypothetical protein